MKASLKNIREPWHFSVGVSTLLLLFLAPLVSMPGEALYFSDLLQGAPWSGKALLLSGSLMSVLLLLSSFISPRVQTVLFRLGGAIALFWLSLGLYWINEAPFPGRARPVLNELDRAWIFAIHLLAIASLLRSRGPDSKYVRWFAGLIALFIVSYFLMEIEGVNRTRVRMYLSLTFEGGNRTIIGLYFLLLLGISLGAVLSFTNDAIKGWFVFVSRYTRAFVPLLFALYFFVLVPPGNQGGEGGTLWIILCTGLFFACTAELLVRCFVPLLDTIVEKVDPS